MGSSRVVRYTRCSGSALSCRAIVSSRRGVLTSRIAVSSRRRVATDTSWLDSASTRRCTARLARVTWSACAATRGRSDANDDHDDDHDKRRRQPHAIARGVRGGHGDGHPLLADERPRARPDGRSRKTPPDCDSERQRGTRIPRSRSAGVCPFGGLAAVHNSHSRPIRYVIFLVVFMCMRRKKSRTKQTKKIVYYSSKKGGFGLT